MSGIRAHKKAPNWSATVPLLLLAVGCGVEVFPLDPLSQDTDGDDEPDIDSDNGQDTDADTEQDTDTEDGDLWACSGESGATYYVRPDGGNASQCTGLTDEPYPGDGQGRDCAFDHPFYALPPGGEPLLSPGDRLIIAAGNYEMGISAPAATDYCDPEVPADCATPPVPSGIDQTRPTCIVGVGWHDGCQNPPTLSGVGQSKWLLRLDGARHVRIGCLELTDRSACVTEHPDEALACSNAASPVDEQSAQDGMVAANAEQILLRDLSVHGLARRGVALAEVANWRLERVGVQANGHGGVWIDGSRGDLEFVEVRIAQNGCGEEDGMVVGCWGEDTGHGLSAQNSSANWFFKDSVFEQNTGSGLLIQVTEVQAHLEISRSTFQGNAATQLDFGANATIINSVVAGNCGYFADKPFGALVSSCRGGGSALRLGVFSLSHVDLVNSTIWGHGSALLSAYNHEDCNCQGNHPSTLRAFNDLFVGSPQFEDRSLPRLLETNVSRFELSVDWSLLFDINALEENEFCQDVNNICKDPLLVQDDPSSLDLRVEPGSPAIDQGLTSSSDELVPDVDILGNPRPAGNGVDLGAYEHPSD